MIGTVTVVLLGAILAYFAWRTYNDLTYFKKLGLRGPTPVPIFGNLLGFKIGVHNALDKWTKQYGKTFGISRGAKKVIVTSDLKFVKEVTVSQFGKFADRQGFPLRPESMASDLLDLKGNRWKAMRETVALTFTKSKMQKMVPMLEECAEITVKAFDERRKDTNGVFDIHKYMAEFGIDVGAFCFFASKVCSPEEKTDLMKQAFNLWSRFKSRYPPWMFIMLFPWTERIFKFFGCSIHPPDSVGYFSTLLQGVIDARKTDPNASQYTDFLQLMMNAKQGQDTEAVTNGHLFEKRSLTEIEIFSMCMTVFTGNMETSPGTLAYLFFLLALHPDIQERVIAEIDEVMADEVTFENVNKMTYMDMVIRESLRMYPTAASLDRLCLEDCTVQGIKISKGMLVEIAVNVIQHDPDNWPDPHTFNPERFSAENKAKMNPSAWLAFGQGPRMCLGYRFAMTEMIVIVTAVLKKYRVEICLETQIPPARGTRGLLSPENGINVRLVPRREKVM